MGSLEDLSPIWMIFGIIAIIALSMGALYLFSRNLGENKRMLIEVVDVLNERTLEVISDGVGYRVVLGGIGFPTGDDGALSDAKALIEDIAKGRRFDMEILKEIEGLKYVSIRASSGDSLNELMLKGGFARFDSRAIGFVNSMIEAENEAREKKLGIWNERRAKLRQFSNEFEGKESVDGNSRRVDQLNEDANATSQ